MQKIALVGNPNTGKTTLFNALTKQNEHVGNYPGVTVEEKQKTIVFEGKNLNIVDLPGLYSLNSFSFEEDVSINFLQENNSTILNICDGNNLKRNLYLTVELLLNNYKPFLVINMANELKKTGTIIDVKKLQQELGIKVFLLNAENKKEVKSFLISIINLNENTNEKTLQNNRIETLKKQEKIILNSNKTQEEKLEIITQKRYELINNIYNCCVKKTSNKIYGYSYLDKLLLNKYLAFPIFLLIIATVFYLTFSSLGKFLSGVLDFGVSNFIMGPVVKLINSITINEFVINLLQEGVLGSVSSVITFLPQVVILFLCLNVLEGSGYLSRLAFTLEDIFSKVGLSGKSVFALLMGFGCSTTASLTARTMEDKNSKIKTALLTPYISCSAKLPLYIVVCGAYFKAQSMFVILLLYLLGVLLSLLVSYILEKTILPSKTKSFIMEFPALRKPKTKNLIKLAIIDVKNFVVRVGTVILTFSCIIWIMQNCSFNLIYIAGTNEKSILEVVGSWFSFLLKPLGLNSYGVISALICGVIAKEIIVSTLKIINSVPESDGLGVLSQSFTNSSSSVYLTPASSLSFLVFSSTYLPCVSSIGVLKKEIGFKWTLFACLLEFIISYLSAFVVYKIACVYFELGLLSCILSCVAFLVFIVSLLFAIKFIKNKNKCRFCVRKEKCKGSCKI